MRRLLARLRWLFFADHDSEVIEAQRQARHAARGARAVSEAAVQVSRRRRHGDRNIEELAASTLRRLDAVNKGLCDDR